MSEANRVETMAGKLAAYARRAGVDSRIPIDAYESAVAHRLAVLGDVFHPDLLHPARTALILLEDVGLTDAELLAAAALLESEFASMRMSQDEIRGRFGRPVADLAAAVPVPAAAGEQLAEELVIAPRAVVLIALAERLDHARHLHFRDQAVWRPFHAQIVEVYEPVAYRHSEALARRFSRWSTAFARRLLPHR